jgi:hypothetical protein
MLVEVDVCEFVTRSDPRRRGAQKGGYADFDVKGIR